ncbi:DNA sulfur modification protein DndB [Nonomuraea sp. NPDC046802]|uniref:DNA sulfur modification protein DndB n=1 Tax=Nonomuraea sp. NPDC046802 TaxID=3154919 RepID=UPI00340AB1B6
MTTSLPTIGGVANQVVNFRRHYVNMTATGLVIIGHVAYEIEKNPDPEWRAARYVDLATKIDWRRDAEIWQGNIIVDDKIATTRGPGRAAAQRVMDVLGIRSPEPVLPLAYES